MKFKQNKAFNHILITLETAEEAELLWEMARDVSITKHVSDNVRAMANKISDHFSNDAQLGVRVFLERII